MIFKFFENNFVNIFGKKFHIEFRIQMKVTTTQNEIEFRSLIARKKEKMFRTVLEKYFLRVYNKVTQYKIIMVYEETNKIMF